MGPMVLNFLIFDSALGNIGGVADTPNQQHTGKCIRRLAGIYAYCRYFIDRKWLILVLILYKKKTCHMPKGL